MSEESDFKNEVRATLKDHGQVLRSIQETLGTIAVQSEQIQALQQKQRLLEMKMDALLDPEKGTIQRLSTFQASCPRKQIKWMWAVNIPLGIALLSAAAKLLGFV